MRINTLIFLIVLTACNKTDPNSSILPNAATNVSEDKGDSQKKQIIDINKEIVAGLKNENYTALAKYIHPDRGIQLSMYSYISEDDKNFSQSEFEKYIHSDEKFTFGHKDGSGAVYTVSLPDYLKNWTFKKDFTKAKINYNIFEGKGNSLNNIKQKYPGAITVENYLAGTVEYSYMDWNSLIFIFEKIDNQHFIVGISNGQWTV